MKKVMAMITLVAVIVGANVIAFAQADLVKKDVDLQVTVSDWATISKLESMAVTLAEPGKFETESQSITIRTNTNVKVEASEPVLKVGDDQLHQATGTGALKWGLGFRSNNDLTDSSRIPSSWFELKAGSDDTRDLVFWAEWNTDKWWELVANDYCGTATITVSPLTAQP